MTLPRTVADVLSRHVTFEIESIDRMYLNVYQPRLQHPGGAAAFFVGHRGFSYASSALMAQMTEAFVADLHHFMAVHDVPLVHFAKGQRKDDVAHDYLAGHDGSDAVLFVGRAQEKTQVISSVRRRNPVTGAAYAWLVGKSALVNHFYVYLFLTGRTNRASAGSMNRTFALAGLRPVKIGGLFGSRIGSTEISLP